MRNARFLIILFFVVGCTTYQTIKPQLNGDPRQITLREAVIVSLHDGRAIPDKESVTALKEGLGRLYGDSISFKGYFDPALEGRINVCIRLVTLGSNFGSRVITSAGYATAYSNATATAATPWGPIIAIGNTQHNIMSGGIATAGWWIGSVWVELEIEDKARMGGRRFAIPLAAEHRESNVWGYESGRKASEAAWNKVVPFITGIFDKIIVIQRDRELNQH